MATADQPPTLSLSTAGVRFSAPLNGVQVIEITNLSLNAYQIADLTYKGTAYLDGRFYTGLKFSIYADDGNNGVIHHWSFVWALDLARGLADALATQHPGCRCYVKQGDTVVYQP